MQTTQLRSNRLTAMDWRSALAAAAAGGLLIACGGTSHAQGSPSPSPSAASTPTAFACTSNGSASPNWPSAESRSPSGAPPLESAVVSQDTLTLEFDQGTPGFAATPQSSAHFTETSGRGAAVDLRGSAGVLILLHGFRGDMQNYAGQQDFVSNGPLVLEVREIGDYEGVIGWAAGLSRPGCASVTATGSTLTVRFISGAG